MLGVYFDRDVTGTPFPLEPHPAPRRRGSYLFLCTKRRLRMRPLATTTVYQVAMVDSIKMQTPTYSYSIFMIRTERVFFWCYKTLHQLQGPILLQGILFPKRFVTMVE